MRMVKVKYGVLLAIAVLAFVAYWYYWGSSRTPPGQPPLASLTASNLDPFTLVFNEAPDRTRLLLLVSPT